MIKKISKTNKKVTLEYHYETSFYYDVSITKHGFNWQIKPFIEPVHKTFTDELFATYIEDPVVFTYEVDQKNVGFIEGSIQSWNQTYRIWNFLVLDEYQNQGIGRALMEESIKHAKNLSCRAVMLEVQSCNYPAIQFYLKQGFKFTGLDTLAYSNEDIEKKEVRLEMGMMI
ncbi:MAG: GNAT family N-acetyltransferase [Acholeplasmataceae bacterium]|jgi:ribosomal protein S18 acetylase RimI-like enzyme|nr:GNAT family N-acetyltransferase [Acholeplasmataceae bacterium]